jgi:hypothetical protein
LNLVATDDQGGTGVKQIMYWATGAQPIASAGSPTIVLGSTASVTITATGSTTFYYHSQDYAGNIEATRSTIVSIR